MRLDRARHPAVPSLLAVFALALATLAVWPGL
jgi:hypothetical protein